MGRSHGAGEGKREVQVVVVFFYPKLLSEASNTSVTCNTSSIQEVKNRRQH